MRVNYVNMQVIYVDMQVIQMRDRKKTKIVKSNIFRFYNIEHVMHTQEEFGHDA